MKYHDIDQFIKKHENDIFRDIARLVAVSSVEGTPQEGAPFGAEPRRALDEALAMARELGLETRDCEHRIGYAVAGEDSDRYLATVAHVDVVGAGEGWTGDPFEMRQKEGYIIGRGVMDDKGPAVLSLYALKYLKESGAPLKYPVRALLGANEETGMSDVRYYLDHYPAPLFAFSPDADFPLINGEKGIFQAKMSSKPIQKGNVLTIQGGFAPNAVPAKAEATLACTTQKAAELLNTEWVTATFEGGTLKLQAKGIGGHASSPEGKVNAIGELVRYILDNRLASKEEEAFLIFAVKAYLDSCGCALGIAANDGRFTPLTAISGMIYHEEDRLVQTLDCRYPTTTSGETIVAQLEKTAGGVAEFEVLNDMPPFWKDPDGPEVTACMAAYNEVTGEAAKPFSIGGGTYARDFPNAVAFGPEHLERPRPAFVGPIHGADEAASKDELLEALKIYIVALLKLEEVEF